MKENTVNMQESYETIGEYFTRKGAALSREGGIGSPCYYRGPDGQKCAAGVLIPDEKYSKIFEGRTVEDVFELLGWELTTNEEHFLFDVQYAHDYAESVEDFLEKLG